MTQAELDLARLAMMIARLSLKAMAATATGLEQRESALLFNEQEWEMEKLARKIETGEYRGSDAGQG